MKRMNQRKKNTINENLQERQSKMGLRRILDWHQPQTALRNHIPVPAQSYCNEVCLRSVSRSRGSLGLSARHCGLWIVWICAIAYSTCFVSRTGFIGSTGRMSEPIIGWRKKPSNTIVYTRHPRIILLFQNNDPIYQITGSQHKRKRRTIDIDIDVSVYHDSNDDSIITLCQEEKNSTCTIMASWQKAQYPTCNVSHGCSSEKECVNMSSWFLTCECYNQHHTNHYNVTVLTTTK